MGKSNIPDGYEDSGIRQGGHIVIRCTKRLIVEGVEVQCIHTLRNCKNPPDHVCHGVVPTPIEQRNVDIMRDIANFIGKANLSLITVEKDYFKEFMRELITLGQENPTAQIEKLIPKINRKNIRDEVVKAGDDIFNKSIEKAHNSPAVTLSIDAGTLSHRHLIDFCLTSPSLKPIFYESVAKPVAGVDEYKNITEAELIDIITKHHVNIVAIVTDNLPVQITAIAHWSPTSIINQSTNSSIKQILFYSCLCHTTQLIVEATESIDPKFAELNGTLRAMILCLRNSNIREIIGANCPQFVATRWLSRMESIDFILYKRQTIQELITNIDSTELPPQTKASITQLFTEANFSKILMLGKLVFPFYVLIKIFEKNNSRQFLAVPCFEQLENFINERLRDEEFLEYHPTLLEFKNQLNIRRKKTMHWELLLSSFVLTLPGRLWLRQKIALSHPNALAITAKELQYKFKKLQFDYVEVDDGNLDRINVEYDSEENDFSNESLLTERQTEEEETFDDVFSYRQAPLYHVNVPLPPSHSTGLYDSILQTIKEVSERINGASDEVDDAFHFYIYDDCLFNSFTKLKNIRSHPETGWLQEVLIPNRVQIANVAFRILPVSSSETSVERNISQQKLILSDLRLKTKDDLANARFHLAE